MAVYLSVSWDCYDMIRWMGRKGSCAWYGVSSQQVSALMSTESFLPLLHSYSHLVYMDSMQKCLPIFGIGHMLSWASPKFNNNLGLLSTQAQARNVSFLIPQRLRHWGYQLFPTPSSSRSSPLRPAGLQGCWLGERKWRGLVCLKHWTRQSTDPCCSLSGHLLLTDCF